MHHAMLVRLDAGKTMADLFAAVKPVPLCRRGRMKPAARTGTGANRTPSCVS
jgi:hypothetical protein